MSDSESTSDSSMSSCDKLKHSPTVKCRMSSVKEWVHRMRPARLVIVLVLSIVYFLVLLTFSHITHALTLLVQCYHMVCNIIALIGSLVMVKVSVLNFYLVGTFGILCHPQFVQLAGSFVE